VKSPESKCLYSTTTGHLRRLARRWARIPFARRMSGKKSVRMWIADVQLRCRRASSMEDSGREPQVVNVAALAAPRIRRAGNRRAGRQRPEESHTVVAVVRVQLAPL